MCVHVSVCGVCADVCVWCKIVATSEQAHKDTKDKTQKFVL